MKPKVQDPVKPPLVPGGVLASVCGDPPSRALRPLDESEVRKWNPRGAGEVLAEFQSAGLVTPEQVTKLLEVERQFNDVEVELERRVSEVSEVTGCDAVSIRRLARALLSARLFAEFWRS
jgi:hypothetical protein